jgi:glycerate 2-kinase
MMRAMALSIFYAGLRAADPGGAVRAALVQVPDVSGRRLILAVGKAGCAMAEAALAGLGPAATLVVTDDANARPVAGAEVLAAGHPLPDARGAAAASRIEALLRPLSAADQIVLLLSGGGSALLPAPVAGIGLADKIEVNRLLLASGLDIVQTNLVRQALSRLKGGGLARMAAPAQVVALILSDVMGDDLRVIASGPTARPVGTRAEAAAMLQAHGLWPQLPAAVRKVLAAPAPGPSSAPRPETVADTEARVRNILIGSNAQSLAAMAEAARQTDLPVLAQPRPLTGDVRDAAAAIIGRAVDAAGPCILLWGGETTVQLGPWAGAGGRNQELALRVALRAEALGPAGLGGRWCFLSAGTDGRDGPTEAAGGLVDGKTLVRMRAAGKDPATAAAAHDALPALKAAGDLLLTGATGTNVADLQVFIRT